MLVRRKLASHAAANAIMIGPLAAVMAVILVAAILLSRSLASADEPAHYVGSAACAACHQAETTLWQTSHHAAAMQPATAATVLGDFNDANFVKGGITTTFHRSGDTYMARTDGPDGAIRDFPIAYTFGVAPLQQYLIAMPGGRYQALGIAWDARAKEAGGQRWYSLYSGQFLAAGDRLHWTGRDQNWNYMCADCHSTDVKKNYNLTTDSFATTYAEVAVGCEACHGPGSRHTAWATAATRPADEPHQGLVAWLKTPDHGVWEMNPQTGIARRTEPLASSAELETCSGCHARAATIVADKTAATPFLDAHMPAMIEAGYYHPDGQIDGEMFEYGSFIQSRMHQAGVTCSDCHEPHALKLRAEGNALCAQCHMPAKFDVPSHHHHEPGTVGAQCVNCHMPTKTYMGVDARRDHHIRVPRPDLSMTLGTPNVCTGCHTHQPGDWAAHEVAEWFPNGRQTQPHYGQALAAGQGGESRAEPMLDALISDPTAPAMARASALLLLPRLAGRASLLAWRAALGDPDPLVRLGAVRALPATASNAMQNDEAPRLADPVRAVRIEAARALAGIDPQILTPEQRAAFSAAMAELIASETLSADRPEAHLNLGLLYERRQLADQADAESRIKEILDTYAQK